MRTVVFLGCVVTAAAGCRGPQPVRSSAACCPSIAGAPQTTYMPAAPPAPAVTPARPAPPPIPPAVSAPRPAAPATPAYLPVTLPEAKAAPGVNELRGPDAGIVYVPRTVYVPCLAGSAAARQPDAPLAELVEQYRRQVQALNQRISELEAGRPPVVQAASGPLAPLPPPQVFAERTSDPPAIPASLP